MIPRIDPIRLVGMLVVTLAVSGCALLNRDLQPPEVRLVAITPERIGFDGIKLRCRLRIDNPNDVAIPVSGGKLMLDIEELQIATGQIDDGFKIPALATEWIDVPVEVNTANSIALLLRVLGSSEPALDYVLTGHIDIALAMLGRVRINERGSVPLQPPQSAGGDQRI